MSSYLLNKKHFFQNLLYENESYICDFVMTAQESYGLAQQGFFTASYVNLYFKELAAHKQTRLIMVREGMKFLYMHYERDYMDSILYKNVMKILECQ